MTEAAIPAAIVLTGGRSTRMGSDKATLVVDGVRLIDRVIGAVRGAGIESIIVAGHALAELADGVESVPDRTDVSEGPLAGVVAAWRHLTDSTEVPVDPVIVLSCDLPRIGPDVISSLLAACVEQRHGAIAHDGTSDQPLVAAYRAVAMDELAVAFAAGERSIRARLAGWEIARISFDPRLLVDVDAPGDLAAFHVEWPDESLGPTAR